MRTRHFLQLIFLSALWGASFPLIRIASPAFGPMGLAGFRCALAAIVLAVLMRVLRQRWPGRKTWLRLTVVSLLTVVSPFLVRLGPIAIDAKVVLAALACTAASASYGFGAILMKRATLAHRPLPASAAVHVAGALILLLPTAATAPAMQPTTGAVIAVAILGMVTSGFMYWLSMRLMREIPASAATSPAFMIPLFGVTWGGLFLGEPVTVGMLPGCLLVLAAMALVTGFNPFKGAPPQP